MFRLSMIALRMGYDLPRPHSASAPPLDVGGSPVRIVQNVEQARPTDMSEEEMQLNLALQLSKQHAEEEERLKYALINCSVSIFLSKGGVCSI